MTHLRLALLLLAATVAATPAAGAPPDYRGYQALLDRYLIPVEAKGEAADSRFDYKQLFVDQNIWARGTSPLLDSLHVVMFDVRPSTLGPADRLAWAINAYNFAVIEAATTHLLIPGHHFQRYTSVDEIDSQLGGFFDVPRDTVEGHPLSLTRLERWYCYGDSTPSQWGRRAKGDPRIQFALCPGFLGGPPLQAHVYTGEKLQQQLDAAARSALAQRRIVSAAAGLAVSQYVFDRMVDFGDEAGLLKFLQAYGTPKTRDVIRKRQLHGVNGGAIPLIRTLNLYEAPTTGAPAANTGS